MNNSVASVARSDRRRRDDLERPFVGRRSSDEVPLVTPFRWGALAVAGAVAAPRLPDASPILVLWFALLTPYCVARTVRPLRNAAGTAATIGVLAEVAVSAAAVASTGFWESPFVFCLLTAVIAAGLMRGFVFGALIGLSSAVGVIAPMSIHNGAVGVADVRQSAQWIAMLLLVAAIAGYTRRIAADSAAAAQVSLDRVGRLTEANELLHALHRAAQQLPASLDLEQVLASSITQLRELLTFDAATILLHEATSDLWVPVRSDGHRREETLTMTTLPSPIQQAIRTNSVVVVGALAGPAARGFAPRAESGLYGPLRSRGTLVGVVAVESNERHRFAERDSTALAGVLEVLALALDNAQWFARLRTLGAEEERTRIARDFHDRIGQSLAYVSFELDRVSRAAERGDEVQPALVSLRDDVRVVIREVRDTLYDLRTDVDEERDFATTLKGFLDRVAERSGLSVSLRTDQLQRPQLPIEREMWRIAQEAVTNVVRHANAQHLDVEYRSGPDGAELVICDDGVGIGRSGRGRVDSYGIIGMRERASAIGARLDLRPNDGKGTTIHLRVEQ